MTDTINIDVNGREYHLTREQADRLARRMAEREPENSAWHETAMRLLDFARMTEGES